jgi:transcription antitermination factor NusG
MQGNAPAVPERRELCSADGAGPLWYAVYTRSRHEFRVLDHLRGAQVEAFLPTVERLSRWKDRKKRVTFPLFPGYLFVHMLNAKARMLEVLKAPGVVRFLSLTPGPPDPVPDGQVEALKRLVSSGQAVAPYPGLAEGRRVRIVCGPLAGMEGVLKQKKGRHLLVLSIDILRQGASVHVDVADVEPL